jgi:hypothetical protein
MTLMTIRILSLVLWTAACTGGNRYNQGYDLGDDTGEPDSGEGEGGDDSSDEGSDDGGDDGGDESGEESGDGGSDDGGDDSGNTSTDYCHNMYHPVHLSGWTKDYYAVYNDEEAESQTIGLAPLSTEEGSETFQYRDVVETPSGESYDVTLTVTCDPGGTEGMFLNSWEGDVNYIVSELFPVASPYTVDATLSTPRQYLPPEYALGAVGNWDYAYTLMIMSADEGGGTPTETIYTVDGTYAEVGFEEFILFDGTTVDAYKLSNTYSMTESGLFGDTVTTGFIEQHFVKGLGLVKEKHSDSENGSIILLKSLTGYSGLEIEE